MGDFWKPTAEMFESLFEKPKMSEKLLSKPPFKYIFDIVIETMKVKIYLIIKVTGFAQGLYSSEELDPNYYSGKDQKI
jgi:TRAF3-interacting protein 1